MRPPPNRRRVYYPGVLSSSPYGHRWPYLWATTVGICFALVVVGWDFLSGDPTVVRAVAGDNAAGLAAFRPFVADDWHYPFLTTANFGDAGVNVAFSDSIPALAVVAKLARPLGIAAETWWAAWFWAVYLLQALSATFAVRSWGGRAPIVQLAAPILALLMPVLLVQTVHPSLSSHFLLLIAWGMVGRFRTTIGRSDLAGAGALTLLALAIHPYLAAMVLIMLIAAALDAVRRGGLTPRAMLTWLAITGAVLGAWLVAGGYGESAGRSEGGYGVYATALGGPVVPVVSDLLAPDSASFEIEPTHAGYAYLGAGLLALALAALLMRWRSAVDALVANQGLATGLGAMAVWAVSPFVRFGAGDAIDLPAKLAYRIGGYRAAGTLVSVLGVVAGMAGLALWLRLRARPNEARTLHRLAPTVGGGAALVLTVALVGLVAPSAIDAATLQLRASGRFAWPALYAVPILGLAALGDEATAGPRWHRPVTAVVLVAVALQFADTGTLRDATRAFLLPGGEARAADIERLVALVEAHDSVSLGPDFRCTYYPDGVTSFIDVTAAASAADRPIDRIYSARGATTGECSVPQRPDLSDPGRLVVLVEPVALLPPEALSEAAPGSDPGEPRAATRRRSQLESQCRTWGTMNLCSHRWDQLDPAIAQHFGPLVD